ncbi:MAG: hypothetical protein GX625_15895 [Clostridiaceae bacterium]|nr:hypothetical protein [Clostridiaceae bacterium]
MNKHRFVLKMIVTVFFTFCFVYAAELPVNFSIDNAGNDSLRVLDMVASDVTRSEVNDNAESDVKNITNNSMENKNDSKTTEDTSLKKKRFIIIGAAILTVTGIVIGIVAGIVNGRDWDSEKKDSDMINDFPPTAPQISITSPRSGRLFQKARGSR